MRFKLFKLLCHLLLLLYELLYDYIDYMKNNDFTADNLQETMSATTTR